MRKPSFNNSTFMSGIFVSSLTAAMDYEEMSKIACAGNTDPEQESRPSCPYSAILFSMSYSCVCVCPPMWSPRLAHVCRPEEGPLEGTHTEGTSLVKWDGYSDSSQVLRVAGDCHRSSKLDPFKKPRRRSRGIRTYPWDAGYPGR
jgi:hypothetical protein